MDPFKQNAAAAVVIKAAIEKALAECGAGNVRINIETNEKVMRTDVPTGTATWSWPEAPAAAKP